MLRAELAQLDEVKQEREVLEGEIKSVTFDMTASFLTALAQDGAINEEGLSNGALNTHYGNHTERVQKSLRAQEDLLAKIQVRTQGRSTTSWALWAPSSSMTCMYPVSYTYRVDINWHHSLRYS